MGSENLLYISAAAQFLSAIWGAVVSLPHNDWPQKHRMKVIMVFALFGLVGMMASIRQGAISSREGAIASTKLSDSLNRLNNASSEISRVQTLNAELQRQLLRSNMKIAQIATRAVDSSTGGTTFPWVSPYVVTREDGRVQLGFSLSKQGDYPLYALRVTVGRAYRASANTIQSFGKSVFYNEINSAISIPIYFEDPPTDNIAHYVVSASARNGNWKGVIEMRRIESRITFREVLFASERPGRTPTKKLFDFVHEGYPQEARGRDLYPLDISLLPDISNRPKPTGK